MDLQAIKERAEAATKGPWTSINERVFAEAWLVDVPAWGRPRHEMTTTATFIAHARADVPALVSAVEERDATIASHVATIANLRREIERLQSGDDAQELAEWRRKAREERTAL